MSARPEDRSPQLSAAPGLFAGAHQPARRSFDIDRVLIGGRDRGVRQADVNRKPFCVLTLLPDNDIHVADWVNARHIPPGGGRSDLRTTFFM